MSEKLCLEKQKEEKGKKLQFSQLEDGKLSFSSELHEGTLEMTDVGDSGEKKSKYRNNYFCLPRVPSGKSSFLWGDLFVR